MNMMKRSVVCGALIAVTSVASWAQRPFYLLPGMHPGYTLVSMRPTTLPTSGANVAPNVGGMAWLPDGKLFIPSMSGNAAGGANANRLGVSHGYIFSGIPGATSNATVTVSQVSTGYQMPSGAVAVGDTIFVLDNEDGLTKLTPSGTGTYTKTTLHNGALGRSPGALSDTANRTWTGGLLYRGGFFYATVGNGLIPGGTSFGFSGTQQQRLYRGKGVIFKISQNGAVVDTFASGMRNPVSLAWGPDSQMFYTDNEGSFMPNSAMFHVHDSAFFGHLNTPLSSRRRTPPAIIFPYGSSAGGGSADDPTVARVATDMLTIRNGMYRNQMLVGVNHTTGMNRVFLEKVADGMGGYVYQGALFPFSQGLGVGTGTGAVNVPTAALPGVLSDFRSNVNRMSYGPDGHIYLGGGNSPGNNSNGSHGFVDGQQYGLARLVPTNDTVFEIKAIRSLDSTKMEIEFTEPIVSAGISNFSVRQWGSLQGGTANNQSYGAGKRQSVANLSVTAVSLNAAKTKAELTISGLKQRPLAPVANSIEDRTWGSTVQILVTNVSAVSNRPMWTDTSATKRGLVGWYTLNRFGPGEDAGSTTAIARSDRAQARTGLLLNVRTEGILVRSPVEGAYTLRVLDTRGRVVSRHVVSAGQRDVLVPAGLMPSGLSILEAVATDGQRFTATTSRF
jgi:hypothetical protein